MTTALEASNKQSYAMLAFSFGSPQVVLGYTNWTHEVVNNGIAHLPTPNLTMRIPRNSGTFKEQKAQVTLPLDAFTTPLTSGEPIAPVRVVISEFTFAASGNPSADRLILYMGELHSAVRNTSNRNDRVLLRFETIKERLSASGGIPSNHQCAHPFTGTGCFYNPTAQLKVGTVVSTSQSGATISGVTAPSVPGGLLADTTYRKGWLERDGIRVLIREWNSIDPEKFVTKRRLPNSWVGETVIVHPGCSKEIEICRGRYDNEEHFGGYGYAIPAYLPVIETQ